MSVNHLASFRSGHASLRGVVACHWHPGHCVHSLGAPSIPGLPAVIPCKWKALSPRNQELVYWYLMKFCESANWILSERVMDLDFFFLLAFKKVSFLPLDGISSSLDLLPKTHFEI